MYSQAEVLRQAMVDMGLGTDPNLDPLQAWPIYADGEPPSPDQIITVFSTAGKVQAREMIRGESIQSPGLQIRVRSTDSRTGRSKMEGLLTALTQQLYDFNTAIVGGGTVVAYNIHCLTDFGNIIALGKEVPNSRRSVFTLNAMIVHQETTLVNPVIVNSLALTNQATDIPNQILYAPSVKGLFRVSVYAATTVIDGGASTLELTITWTDDSGQSRSQVIGSIGLTSLGNTWAQRAVVVECAANAQIDLQAVGGETYGAARYSLYAVVEQIA